MVKINLPDENRIIECDQPTSLYDVLSMQGLLDAPCGGQNVCGKCRVTVDGESVLSCHYTVTKDIAVQISKKSAINVIEADGYYKEFSCDFFPESVYGVAVDIGTTTVVATLVNLHTGQEISSLSCLNSQKAFGQDVITRINYTYEKENGLHSLQKMIVGDLRRLMQELYLKNNVNPEQITRIAIGGNTTMIHLLLGVNPIGIAMAPYMPAFSGSVIRKAQELGLPAAEDCMIYCLPAVSSFVGGDITAGILACNLALIQERVLFIDIGTNGEIVLSDKGKMYCCSCAAGPALEGMNISSGMRASHGAIDDVLIKNDKVIYTTIGGTAAEGICGSGILSAVSEMRGLGIIHPTGRLLAHPLVENIDGKKCFVIDREREIYLTQKDIRQVQLAKGAILSGVYSLLENSKMEQTSLDRVFVAGQFGAHLKAESMTGAGLLPTEWQEKITYVGNTSKSGAYICLLSDAERTEAENMVPNISYTELSTLSGYEDLFVKCLNFI